jgi:hypothetical protein|tara:strand:+ start:1136 stop:2014 length:879 start_codon:yes stop_codon:yes gene_type:complete
MAISGKITDIILELYNRDFFKKISSVIDMGDQDVNHNYSEIENYFKKFNVKFDPNLFSLSKNFPSRPRVSSSVLWKTLGVTNADKIDLEKLERPENQNIGKVFEHDLNFPLKDKNLIGKYDLVTDFGNNEHPFNFIETFKTMHILCKEKGYLMIDQCVFKGNGFVNFDVSFFENFAAVNHYSTVHSCLIFHYPNNKYFTTPIEKDYLGLVDLNKVENIGIFYIFKKEKSEDFKFPYQGRGSAWNSTEMYSVDFSFKDGMPHKFYIPQTIDHISFKKILKTIWKKIKRRLKIL